MSVRASCRATVRPSVKPVARNGASGVSGVSVYADSKATGSNDGTSWSNAFVDLQDALDSLVGGETLYTNSTRALPFIGGFSLVSVDNVNVITNQGSDSETWITDARKATWTDAGSGIFTLSLAAKPTHIAYDFKQDDASGTTTGIAFDRASWSAMRTTSGFAQSDLLSWYGFLTENTGTPTTPSNGEWGHSGGVLYINPPGSPVVADVNTKAEYVVGGTNGIDFNGCNYVSLTGRLIGYLYPDNTSNAGYVIRGNGVTNCTFDGVIAIACGYHATGMAAASGSNNTLSNSICNGASTALPFVFYTDNDLPNASHVGEDLAFVAYPLLRYDGRALSATTYGPRVGYSHSTGGNKLGGITWTRLFLFDGSGDILTAAGSLFAIPSSVNSSGIVGAANIPVITDYDDATQYKIRCFNSQAVGINALLQSNVYHESCIADRTGYGSNTASVISGATGSASLKWYLKDCTVYTGDFGIRWVTTIASDDGFCLDGCTVEMQSTNAVGKSGLLGVSEYATDVVTLKNGNEISIKTGTTGANSIIRGGATTIYTLPILYVISDGSNTFRTPGSVMTSTDAGTVKDAAWWAANVNASDTFIWP